MSRPVPPGLSGLDRSIYLAIRGSTRTTPASLSQILDGVDAQERLVLSHDELAGGLERLIADGYVGEAAHLLFFDPAPLDSGHREFSGISEVDYRESVDRYVQEGNRLIAELLGEVDAGCAPATELAVSIVWPVGEGEYPTDADANAAIPLLEAIAEAVEPTGLAHAAGFEYGPGALRIFLWATEASVDREAVRAVVAPIVSAFPCPVGTLIIRHDGPGQEVVSDVMGRP